MTALSRFANLHVHGALRLRPSYPNALGGSSVGSRFHSLVRMYPVGSAPPVVVPDAGSLDFAASGRLAHFAARSRKAHASASGRKAHFEAVDQ